jgi:hypothetical protein
MWGTAVETDCRSLASLKAESAALPLSLRICDMDYEAGKSNFTANHLHRGRFGSR